MKPDWKDAPEWANCLAMDKDGEWYWYECNIWTGGGEWITNGRFKLAEGISVIWEETKEKRP